MSYADVLADARREIVALSNTLRFRETEIAQLRRRLDELAQPAPAASERAYYLCSNCKRDLAECECPNPVRDAVTKALEFQAKATEIERVIRTARRLTQVGYSPARPSEVRAFKELVATVRALDGDADARPEAAIRCPTCGQSEAYWPEAAEPAPRIRSETYECFVGRCPCGWETIKVIEADIAERRLREHQRSCADPAPSLCVCGHSPTDHRGGRGVCLERDRGMACGCRRYKPKHPPAPPRTEGGT